MNNANDMEFNDLTGEVSVYGINYRFRPKTFDLLRLLASSPAQVFSKTTILQQIWPEAIVEEQAVFQSINEIRKAFAPVEVIKTYPKKGYAWVLPPTLEKPRLTTHQQLNVAPKRFLLPALAVFLLSMLFLMFSGSSWLLPPETSQNTVQATGVTGANTLASHRAILVLPFDVSQLDGSQHWLRFAGMDALINQLQPTSELTVFQLADVIDILNRLPSSASPENGGSMSQSEIRKLFQVAGITQIVQVTITGVPGDYQLIYNLHHADSQQKSAVHSVSLEQSMPLLAQHVSAQLSQPPSGTTAVHSHLLASTLELVASQQFSQALPLATSAVTLDPTNILAYYVLSGIQLQLGNFVEAFAIVEKALSLQDAPGYRQYQGRLWYQKGVLLLQSRDFLTAEPALLQATALANQQQDWLYLAYSKAMLAQLKLAQQQYEQALSLLHAALQYQQMLHCPLGIAQSELDLAGYFMLTGQAEQAKQRYQASADLVQQRGLNQLQPALLEFETRWLRQSAR